MFDDGSSYTPPPYSDPRGSDARGSRERGSSFGEPTAVPGASGDTVNVAELQRAIDGAKGVPVSQVGGGRGRAATTTACSRRGGGGGVLPM